VSEIILSATAGNVSVVDGMLRTVMVASQTASTIAVMVPDGEAIGQRNVARGAHLLALPTMDAGRSVDDELLVGDHAAVEIAAHYMAHHPRRGTFPDVRLPHFPVDNQLGELFQLLLGTSNLPLLLLGCVGVHKRQTYIALGHHQREEAGGLRQSGFAQVAVEDIHRHPNAVTTSGEGITVVVLRIVEVHLLDEVTHDSWRLPTVGGKDEANTLTLRQSILTPPLLLFGDIKQLFASGLGQRLRRPTRVSRS